MSFLADRYGEPCEGEGVPTYLVLEPGDRAREAVRPLPAAALLEAWDEPWLSRGVRPPRRSVTDLRRELEKRASESLKAAPRTRPVPVSQAAREFGIPERTLRAQITRGAQEADWNGRGELTIEMQVSAPVRVRLPRLRPDPRVLFLMASDGTGPGQAHRLGYCRRSDGENWREAL